MASPQRKYNSQRGQHFDSSNKPRILFKQHPLNALVVIATLVTIGFRAYHDMKRDNIIPDLASKHPVIEFPETGTVNVGKTALKAKRFVPFSVITAERKAVVQLLNRKDQPVYSLFIDAFSRGESRAPAGFWTMRIIEGHDWRGNEEMFGANTSTERVRDEVDLSTNGFILDLRRRVDGNLKVRTEMNHPRF